MGKIRGFLYPEDYSQKAFYALLGAAIIVSLAFLQFYPTELEKTETLELSGSYELEEVHGYYTVECTPIPSETVIATEDYRLHCYPELGDIPMDIYFNGSLAVLKIKDSITGETLSNKKTLTAEISNGSYVGGQNFIMDLPNTPGSYLLSLEINREVNGSTKISEETSDVFRVHSPSDKRTADFREVIILLNTFIIFSAIVNTGYYWIRLKQRNEH